MIRNRQVNAPMSPAPYIAGYDGERLGDVACSACRVIGKPLGADFLCVDYDMCCDRYRDGLTAATYAAGLRGELLGVAL